MIEQSFPVLAPWLWSFVYGASLVVLACAAVYSMRMAKGSGSHLLKWASAFALALISARFAGGIEQFSPHLSENVLLVLRAATLIAGGSLASWLVASALLHRRPEATLRPAIWLAINGVWLLALSSEKLTVLTAQPSFDDSRWASDNLSAADLIKVRNISLETDRGRMIAAYRPDASSHPSAHDPGLNDVTIFLAPPDPNSNCHGWVFTGGRFIILGRDVDSILSDNDYRRVAGPQVGDVVVYRSPTDNTVLHTGVVRAAEADLVLIESKWGPCGRYLHQPEHQPYSKEFAYYRSSRPGHELLDSTAPVRTARQRSPRQVDRKKRIQLSCITPLTSASL